MVLREEMPESKGHRLTNVLGVMRSSWPNASSHEGDTNNTTACRGLAAMSAIATRQSAEGIVDEKSVGKIPT